jgi:hypothetical protein
VAGDATNKSDRSALIALYADREPDPDFADAIDEAREAMSGCLRGRGAQSGPD